jgi:hypothetical protein
MASAFHGYDGTTAQGPIYLARVFTAAPENIIVDDVPPSTHMIRRFSQTQWDNLACINEIEARDPVIVSSLKYIELFVL